MGDTQNNDKPMLEYYKILYQSYADEIKNLWQRSIFLGAFMVLVWTGYGVSLLKFLDSTKEIKLNQRVCCNMGCLESLCEYLASVNIYHFILLGLCGVIMILSLLWIAMAKGSKFVQEAHERHIKKFIGNNDIAKGLYCNLKDYEYLSKKDNLFFCGVLKPYRYSPSKINIALGLVSCSIGLCLFALHILAIICHFVSFRYACLIALLLFIVLIILWIILMCCLKGGN